MFKDSMKESMTETLRLFTPNLRPTPRPGYTVSDLRNDMFGGITAAVVALPLALAFGVASGAGAIAGLYGAIATGFFAAVFGGTAAQVTGPTGPMTVVMAAIVASHANDLTEAFAIVTLGGILQIGFGALRLGRYIIYTPYSVVSGFMTGIGLIIIILETLPMIGLPTSTGGVIGTLQTLGSLQASDIDLRVVAFSSVATLLIVLWPARLNKILPAPLAALVVGTLVSTLFLHGLPELGEVPTGLPSLSLPAVSAGSLMQLISPAFVLALLGSIDSLLTSLVADSVTRTQHDSNKELVGQGLGNIAAGLIGALPGAGATMRTVINVRAGGQTPVSGAIHALVLLALALGLGPIVRHVPHAILAAILLKVGWDIIDWGYLKHIRRAPRDKTVVMLVTLTLTVFVDLITAVAVGIILASFVTSRWLGEDQLTGLTQTADGTELEQLPACDRERLEEAGGQVVLTFLNGSFSYASARLLAQRAAVKVASYPVAIYDLSNLRYLDTSAALAIDELIAVAGDNHQHVLMTGLSGAPLRTLEGLGILDRIPGADRFESLSEAIQCAVNLVRA
jgi:SulP family sulfate permease